MSAREAIAARLPWRLRIAAVVALIVAARHDIAYVCIPAGTRNHFGLDRDDVVGALLQVAVGR